MIHPVTPCLDASSLHHPRITRGGRKRERRGKIRGYEKRRNRKEKERERERKKRKGKKK
jgi:hypothetical protein